MTPPETLHVLAPDILQRFSRKGIEGGSHLPQIGNANGVKVRRIMQLMLDLAASPVGDLSVLDLACGEGVYAIEAALRGAKVLAVDARTERMRHGVEIAARLGLTNVTFQQNDVRKVSADAYGAFDVVFLLGILYHLDVPDVFQVVEQLARLCRGWLLIDTHVSLSRAEHCSHRGRIYHGIRAREHGDDDAPAERESKVMASLDNTLAFQFDRSSLIRLLVDAGFTTVVECHAPLEADKPPNRITLAVRKNEPAIVSTYPWVNGRTEDQIEQLLREYQSVPVMKQQSRHLARLVNGALRRFGFEIRRVT